VEELAIIKQTNHETQNHMKIGAFFKYTFLVASLLCVTTYPAAAQAQRGGGGMGGAAVLTQEQRTKMNEAIRDDMAPLRETLVAAQKEVVKAALGNASEATVKAKIEAVNKVQTEMALLRLKGIKAIASSLTSEQKSQLESARDGGYNALFGMMGGIGGGARGARGGGGGGNN
jgi:Spy/CpxP family protein refolding chaperone